MSDIFGYKPNTRQLLSFLKIIEVIDQFHVYTNGIVVFK